jgi:glycosyltransferase involved in cell wall biosynthesis
VLVSHFLERYFVDSGVFAPRAAHVIPNGIDCGIFAPGASTARAELGIPHTAPLVGAVGNMRPAKAYDVLLRAFAHVLGRIPEARLVIAGQGGNAIEDRLVKLAGELEIAYAVTFAGFRPDIPALMRAFDVYALSSSDEGFSLTTVQAMATGLPVVATRCGGPEEILADPGHGLLVANGDPEALASALLEVLGDRARAAAMGRRAREHAVTSYSIEAMVDRYADLYSQRMSEWVSPADD